jgi:hypothetical protein
MKWATPGRCHAVKAFVIWLGGNYMHRIALALVMMLAIGSFSGAAHVAAQEEGLAELTAQYPEVQMIATDFAFDVPEQIESGFTLVTMVNEGIEPHHVQLMLLNEGVTMDDVEEAFGTSEAAVFGLGVFAGGPTPAMPGGTSEVVLDLEPGMYLALCFIESPDGLPHIAKGMVATFEVIEGENDATAPEAAGTVVMSDFIFELPEVIQAGPQFWEVVNEGPQPHEIVIWRLAEGVPAEDLIGMLGEEEAAHENGHDMEAMEATPELDMEGPMPFEPAGGMQGLSTGLTGWAVLDLQPGEYLALCFIPDPNTGQSHLALGMVEAFTVE